MREDAVSVGRAAAAAWYGAAKSPYMQKKAKMVGTGRSKKRATMMRNGKEVLVPVKTNRCLRKSAVKALFSGAAHAAAQQLAAEAGDMEVEVNGEANVAAALPAYKRGVDLLLEHALIAYAQTIFDVAVRIKTSMGIHQKVTTGCMAAACAIVNKKVFATSGIAPGVVPLDFVKSKKKATKKAKKASTAQGATQENE